MISIGDTLRRERRKRNLELPQIAGELKISTRFLEAMEHDDFAKLPGGVFTKSFIRQYASLLGLDAEELVAQMEFGAEPEPVSQIPSQHKPDVPGIDLQIGNWQSVTERRTAVPSWVRAGVLLIVLMLVCSGVYYWWQRPRHPVLARELQPPTKAMAAPLPAPTVSRPVENPPADPNSSLANPPAATPASVESSAKPVPAESSAMPSAGTPPSGIPPAATPSAAVPSAAAPVSAPPATTTAAAANSAQEIPVVAPNPNATVRVGITADEPVWVRAVVNGKSQFEGVLQAHESRSIDVDGEVTLRLGNAGGATLTLNGKPVGAVGPKGQIRTVQFTSGGFQIVSAPPKLLDPLDRL
jgi:cytoskeleton protein RodZ